MTKTNKTRSALFTSIISLLLCVSMLVGTTFAWFTDSVESGRNLITAGNLDVELYWSADCNSWTKVKADTNIFDDGYWEPGHTEVVYLKVVNEGTLALKYQLGVNIVSEQPGTNVAGKVFNLSDYIQFGVADRATAYTGRAEAVAAVAGSSKKISSGFSKSSELYPANSTEGASEECVALVVYMPETVGNEANYMTGTTPPQISLGLNVFATQETYENDSFGADYDENTMWAGDTDTSWYNDTDTEFTLDTPQKLAGLAELVNNGNSFAGKTIKLGADIDLNGDEGVLWTPIGIADNNFNGRFIGTGHTISNLYAVGTTGVGLIGIAGNAAHIEGVTVIGADVVGTHYVGAVLGYGYLAKDCLINCYVEGATIICNPVQKADGSYDDGNQAGVIAGMALNGNITGNTAKNSTVYAYRDMGGIVGCASAENRDVKVEGNTIEGVKLIQVGVMGTYEKDANIGDIVGRIAEHTGKVTIGTNTGTAEIDKSKAITINTLAELVAFAEMVNAGKTYKGETILLGADIDLGNREWTPIGEGSNAFQGTFDGQGHVISNLKITGNNNKVGLFGNTNSGEIKNLTIENALVSGRSNVGVVAGNPYTSRYTNITVKGHVEVNGKFYVGGVGGKNAYTNWTNITVDVDETSYVKADSVEDGVAYRTYVGGVVGFNGEGGHTFKNITSNIDVFGTTIDVGGAFGIAHYGNNFENVTVTGNVTITDAAEAGDAEEIGGIAGVWMNSGSNVTFTNCKFTGKLTSNISEGVDLSDNTITGKGYYAEDSNFLIIDGVNQYDQAVVANATDLADALSAGKDVILTQNVTLSETVEIPAGAEVTLNLNGKTVSGH